MLSIEFHDDAMESFDNLIVKMTDYNVEVVPEDGGNPELVRLIGIDHSAGWYGTLRVFRLDEDYEPTGNPVSVRVKTVRVY